MKMRLYRWTEIKINLFGWVVVLFQSTDYGVFTSMNCIENTSNDTYHEHQVLIKSKVKVKLFLCLTKPGGRIHRLIKHHAMETFWWVEI
jgi:hypothetical protein